MPDEKLSKEELEFLDMLWQKEKEFFLSHLDELREDVLIQELHQKGEIESVGEGFSPLDFLPGDVVRVGNELWSRTTGLRYVIEANAFRIRIQGGERNDH